MFLVIEFLSAWYLKQYRHCRQTAIHLKKARCIFDRYMLSFLAMKDACCIHAVHREQAVAGILQILRDEVKWPDAELLKRDEVGFVRELMHSASEFMRSIPMPGRNNIPSAESDGKGSRK